jgi:prepilin-type N-terminal cleavage/methylation domain-containing protein
MKKKGFTLVELMVVVGILSIIMLVISQPVASVIKYQRESQISDNMRDNLQFVINKIEKELKTASEVNTISSGTGLTFIDQNGVAVSYSYSIDDNEIIKNGSIQLTENTVFKVMNLRFWKNSTNLTTMTIEAQSIDDKDNVTMQTSVLPLND